MDTEERIAALERRPGLGPFFNSNLEKRLDSFEARIAALESLVGKPGERRLKALEAAAARRDATNKALLDRIVTALRKALK